MKVPGEISKTFLNAKLLLNEKEVGKMGAFESFRNPLEIEKLVKKLISTYRRTFEKKMTAITFAEAGEFDIAKDILGNEKKDEKT